MSGLLNKLKKNKTPEQLVAAMVEALDQGQDAQLAKRLSQIKFVLYGEEEREPDEARCAVLSFLNGKNTHTIGGAYRDVFCAKRKISGLYAYKLLHSTRNFCGCCLSKAACLLPPTIARVHWPSAVAAAPAVVEQFRLHHPLDFPKPTITQEPQQRQIPKNLAEASTDG